MKNFPTPLKATLLAFGIITALITLLIPAKESLALYFITAFMGDSFEVTTVERLTLGKITTLQVSDLTFLNEQQNRIEINSLQISIDILHLLSTSQLLLPKINAEGITLNVTEWFDTETDSVTPDWLRNLMVQNIVIRNSKVLYSDPDQNINVHFEKIELLERIANTPLDLVMSGRMNNLPFYVAGTVGTSTPFSQSRDFSFSLHGIWDQLTISAAGQIDPSRVVENSAVRVDVGSPNARQLLDLLGAKEVRDGELSAKLVLASDKRGINLQADVSIGEFHGTFSGLFKSREQIDLAFSLSGPSMFEAGAILDYLKFSKTPFQMAGTISKGLDHFELTQLKLVLDEGSLIGSISLPKYPELVDASISLAGSNFNPTIFMPISGSCHLPDVPMQWKLHSKPSILGAQLIDVEIEGGNYSIKATGDLSTNLKFSLNGFTLLDIGQCFGILELPSIPLALSGNAYTNFLDWHVPVFSADSTLVNMSGSLHWQNNVLSTNFNLETEDLKNLLSKFVGDTGPLANVPATARVRLDGPVDKLVLTSASISLGNFAEATVQGVIGNLQTLEDISLVASVAGINLRAILPDLEASDFNPQPFDVKAKIRYEESQWKILDLIAKVAKTKISGIFSLPSEGLTNFNARLEVEGMNLQNLAGPWLNYAIPALPYHLSFELDHKQQLLNISELAGNIGDHHFSMQLLLDGSPDIGTSSGFAEISGESSQELLALLNEKFDHIDSHYQTKFSINNSPKATVLRNIVAELGQTEFSGDVDWRSGNDLLVNADLKVSRLHLPTFFPALSSSESSRTDSKKRLFSNTPINLDWINTIDSNIEIEAENVYFTSDVSAAMSIHVLSESGVLKTKRFNWRSSSSNGNAEFTLDTSNTDRTTIVLNMKSDRIPLLWFLGGAPLQSGHTTLFAMSVNSVGQTQAELMKNLSGRAIFHGGGGTLKTKALDWLFGDFLSYVSRELVKRKQSTDVTIQCTAAGLQIDAGVVTISPALAIRTDRLDVFVTGKINLEKETSDLYINTRARTGLGLSVAKVISPRTRVTGPLSKPAVQPDLASSAIFSGAAFLSGGMSILASGIFDRIRAGSINPCQSVFEGAKGKNEFSRLLLSPATGS
jgi:hypothetical protein